MKHTGKISSAGKWRCAAAILILTSWAIQGALFWDAGGPQRVSAAREENEKGWIRRFDPEVLAKIQHAIQAQQGGQGGQGG